MNLKHRRKSHHNSYKAGLIYCDSSYEIKAALILDADANVITYQTHIGFRNAIGNRRFVDFIVTYADGSKKIIEIKPFRRLDEYKEQIEDNRIYATSNNLGFEVWTEQNLGFSSEHEATKWADHYLSTITKIDFVSARKELNRVKANRHYAAKIATDTIEVFCPFCQATHTALRLTHDKNIARNGRYICEKEGGHIAGSKPKLTLRKVNPHAAEGKKQCNQCKEIKLFDEFGIDKTKADGYATRCKKCRAERNKNKYNEK